MTDGKILQNGLSGMKSWSLSEIPINQILIKQSQLYIMSIEWTIEEPSYYW